MNWEGHNPVQKSAPHWTAGLGSGGGCGVAQSDGLLSMPYHPGTGKGDFLREMTEIRVRRAEEGSGEQRKGQEGRGSTTLFCEEKGKSDAIIWEED